MGFVASEENGVIRLEDSEGGVTAEVFTFGGLLNRFSLLTGGAGINVIDGYASLKACKKEIEFWFKSARLSPFANRLAEGSYTWQGKEYKATRHYLGKHAIHGLVYDCDYVIKDLYTYADSAGVVLAADYNKNNEGYPFRFSSTIEWRLSKGNELSLSITVRNDDETSMPYMEGWHPYFLMDIPIDGCLLKVNATERLELKEGIPTGKKVADADYTSYQVLRNKSLDDCFVLHDFSQPACILKGERIQLSIRCDESFPYLQVFTPEHRLNIAIENQSSATNAFNNQIGLLTIAPGQTKTFRTSYRLESTI